MKTVDMVAYLSPEQVQGSGIDHRSDLFSLGVIAYELVTGKRLFPQQNVSELMAAILRGSYDLAPLTAHTDKRVSTLIENCLALRKEQRLASATDLAGKIDEILQDRLCLAR